MVVLARFRFGFHIIPFSVCLCTNSESSSVSSKNFINLMYADFLSPAVAASANTGNTNSGLIALCFSLRSLARL